MLMVNKWLILPFGVRFSICKTTQERHHMLFSRYFREELQQRIQGRSLFKEGPIVSCSLTMMTHHFVLEDLDFVNCQ